VSTFPGVQTMRRAQRGEKSCEQINDASSGSNNNKNSNNKYNQSGRNISSNNVCRTQLCFSSLKAPGARLETAMAMYGSVVKTNKEILWEDGYQADPRDPRTQGQGPCGRIHTPEKIYPTNQWCVWLNCEVCALRLHYAPMVGAPSTSVSLGPTPARVEEMLSRLRPFDESEINGNMVRGLLKTIQGEAQVRSSHKGGKKSTGTTPKSKEESHGSSYKGDVGAKTTSNSEAAASSTGGHADEESWELFENAAVDRWEIFVRKLLKQ